MVLPSYSHHQNVKGVAPGTEGLFLTDEGIEAALNEASMALYRESCRPIESDSPKFAEFIALMSPVFEYLGASCSPKMAAVRLWALLYAVRPDLIEFESLASASKRFDVAEPVISKALRELKAAVPGFTYAHREPDNVKVGKGVVAALERRTSKTLRGRHCIQRRAALLRDGADLDAFGEFIASRGRQS